MRHTLARWLLLTLLLLLALQVFFVVRLALMAAFEPVSTSFQRSELWRLARQDPGGQSWQWRQQWVSYAEISEQLKRAVIASEDGSFAQHEGVDWAAIERAWQHNAQAEEQAADRARPAKVRGGSTITQQLAKNLFLSGERTLLRKGQELALAYALEALLSKQRILELYLNHVEWGEGVFGAQAAARHYFGKNASQLNAAEAARLAVMLPRPRHFERNPRSAYLNGRTRVILRRMPSAALP